MNLIIIIFNTLFYVKQQYVDTFQYIKKNLSFTEHFLKILVNIEFGARRLYLSTNLLKIVFKKMKKIKLYLNIVTI